MDLDGSRFHGPHRELIQVSDRQARRSRAAIVRKVDLERSKSLRDRGTHHLFAIGNRDSPSIESDRPRAALGATPQVGVSAKGVVLQRAAQPVLTATIFTFCHHRERRSAKDRNRRKRTPSRARAMPTCEPATLPSGTEHAESRRAGTTTDPEVMSLHILVNHYSSVIDRTRPESAGIRWEPIVTGIPGGTGK